MSEMVMFFGGLEYCSISGVALVKELAGLEATLLRQHLRTARHGRRGHFHFHRSPERQRGPIDTRALLARAAPHCTASASMACQKTDTEKDRENEQRNTGR